LHVPRGGIEHVQFVGQGIIEDDLRSLHIFSVRLDHVCSLPFLSHPKFLLGLSSHRGRLRVLALQPIGRAQSDNLCWSRWWGPGLRIEGDGDTIFRHACKLGLEGIVSKRKDSPTAPAALPIWLKMKNPAAPAVRREAEEDWGKDRWR
jgi:hypothetical protein